MLLNLPLFSSHLKHLTAALLLRMILLNLCQNKNFPLFCCEIMAPFTLLRLQDHDLFILVYLDLSTGHFLIFVGLAQAQFLIFITESTDLFHMVVDTLNRCCSKTVRILSFFNCTWIATLAAVNILSIYCVRKR